MSLKPMPIPAVPEETARVALAAFPKGNLYIKLHNQLGTIVQDEDFAPLFPKDGQPSLPPWRLALVTILHFRENLSDRQAADAVRARIDWKYLLSLEVTDARFDFSVLSEFRVRLVAGGVEELLLEKLLQACHSLGLVQARGQQRTDSTHVLAAIRLLNRLELVSETLRATLNEVAVHAPEWLRRIARSEWYQRYKRRIEEDRLPKSKAAREEYAKTVGEDGFYLLDALDGADAPPQLRALPIVATLRTTWKRHYERVPPDKGGIKTLATGRIRWRENRELARATEGIESPYDAEARYHTKRTSSGQAIWCTIPRRVIRRRST